VVERIQQINFSCRWTRNIDQVPDAAFYQTRCGRRGFVRELDINWLPDLVPQWISGGANSEDLAGWTRSVPGTNSKMVRQAQKHKITRLVASSKQLGAGYVLLICSGFRRSLRTTWS
jgi:hypothetical protein